MPILEQIKFFVQNKGYSVQMGRDESLVNPGILSVFKEARTVSTKELRVTIPLKLKGLVYLEQNLARFGYVVISEKPNEQKTKTSNTRTDRDTQSEPGI